MTATRKFTGWLRRRGKLEKCFGIALLLDIFLDLAAPSGAFAALVRIVLIVLGFGLAVRLTRMAIRTAIWRLRNRLLVTYLFIAVVPVLLIVTLVGLGAYILASQIAMYLAHSELDRKAAEMQAIAETLARAAPPVRQEAMRRLGETYQDRYPGVSLWVQEGSSTARWPAGAAGDPPSPGWGPANGVVTRDGRYYAWSHLSQGDVRFTAATPLSRKFLSEMVPGLGDVYFLEVSGREGGASGKTEAPEGAAATPANAMRVTRNASPARPGIHVGSQDSDMQPMARETGPSPPPAVSRFDLDVRWGTVIPVSFWRAAGKSDLGLLAVHTRMSAILNIIASQKVDEYNGILPIALLVIASLFLAVELVALVIGTSLTRTITGAVHALYLGTQRVTQGDFAHRIQVSGRDQLAELGRSFNSMTENLERLLVVAKEKERLQAEIEIAREVQEQLYPKTAPSVRTLRLTALCQPARMVSGDYYDFQRLHDNKLAIAIGDVAGKGISAALLMASIQSAMRMELRSSLELAAPASQPVNGRLSTARMVSDLNQQLYATTSPEKYATFYLSLYDEMTGVLDYTNAGHLPPILFRNGEASQLDVNGTVVGAFPKSIYEESAVQLESGDLLVCYTDGITEPENEYGEMYGEERLIDIVCKNIDREESRIIEIVMDAVRQWTGSPELQDDMTILLARKQ